MQRYIRLAGIETKGATESLKVLPETLVMDQAAREFSSKTVSNFTRNDRVQEGAAL